MLETLSEFIKTIIDIDFFTALVVLALVAAVFGLVKLMTDSMVLGSLYAPFLIVGALTSKYLIFKNSLVPAADKDSAIVLAVAGGVLPTLVALLVVTRLFNMISERRNARSRAGMNSLLAAHPAGTQNG